jgi:hypothetical protein
MTRRFHGSYYRDLHAFKIVTCLSEVRTVLNRYEAAVRASRGECLVCPSRKVSQEAPPLAVLILGNGSRQPGQGAVTFTPFYEPKSNSSFE